MRRYFFGLAMMALAMMSPTILRADDSQIARQIIERLQVEKKAGNLKGFSIDLQVDDGSVWMSGKLNSEEQRAKVLDIARRIPGVKQVVNDLKVPGERAKPQAAAAPSEESQDAVVPNDEGETATPKTSAALSILNKVKPSFWATRREKTPEPSVSRPATPEAQAEETASTEEATPPAPANQLPTIKAVSGSAAIGTGVPAAAGKVQAAATPYYTPAQPVQVQVQQIAQQQIAPAQPQRQQPMAARRECGTSDVPR